MEEKISNKELHDKLDQYKELSQELGILVIEMLIAFSETKELTNFKNQHNEKINNVIDKLNKLKDEV